jgi:hypothetical protein
MSRTITIILEVDEETVEREFDFNAVIEKRIDLHETVADMFETINNIKNF